MPKTHSSPYHTVETALVSILCILSTHSRLPFKDEASDQSKKRAIVRGYPEVFGGVILWQATQQ